jgi:hypothetical protein
MPGKMASAVASHVILLLPSLRHHHLRVCWPPRPTGWEPHELCFSRISPCMFLILGLALRAHNMRGLMPRSTDNPAVRMPVFWTGKFIKCIKVCKEGSALYTCLCSLMQRTYQVHGPHGQTRTTMTNGLCLLTSVCESHKPEEMETGD